MKQIGFIIIGLIFTGLFFLNGCDTQTSTEQQYYYVEMFSISKTNLNSVPLPSATFDSIKNFRNQLRKYTVDAYSGEK